MFSTTTGVFIFTAIKNRLSAGKKPREAWVGSTNITILAVTEIVLIIHNTIYDHLIIITKLLRYNLVKENK